LKNESGVANPSPERAAAGGGRQRPGCRGVNVRQHQLEARFVELLDRLRPRPEILRLLSAAVLDSWNEEQREVVARSPARHQLKD
jgi:hypothetical protein